MKKQLAIAMSGLLAFFGMTGCGKTTTETKDVEKTYGAYSKVWTASDPEVTHETGDLAIDDGWGSVLDTNVGALCSVKTEELHPTAYTAAARLLVNERSASSKDVACVLRVLDDAGRELGRSNVHISEFDAKLTYQDFTFTFPVETTTEATFEIYWPGTNYVRVSEFGIMSRTNDSLPDFSATGESLLGADIEENVEYSESALYFFDLYDYMVTRAADAEEQYDIANLVSTLQGLVNRDGQRLFIRFTAANNFSEDVDGYWLNYLTQEGNFLGDKNVVTVKSPTTLLDLFKNYYKGFAAWDPAVPATVNAVATACGAADLLPVRYSTVRNSLYWYVQNNAAFSEKEVKVNLGEKFTGGGTIYGTETPSTGSRKNDAYIWAKETYLDTHKTNSHMVAYHVDAYGSNTVFAAYGDLQNMFLSNRDYYIANKAFFFDLSPMEFEIPDDDPDQQDIDTDNGTTDYATFNAIMRSQAEYAAGEDESKPIDVGGFTPWHLKYTRYTNPVASGEVACEWETVWLFSVYNAYINADAPSYTAMANASIYMNYSMKASYTQKGSKTVKESLPAATEQGANYLLFYMGDFDASAWLNTAMIKLWNDPKRGEIPLCWTFSLDIAKRAGHVVDMMYSTATENDYFVAGDNGAGYLNPMAYANSLHEGVYGDLDSWAAYNKALYERFDIDYTGFVVTRSSVSKEIVECYAKFCKGMATNFPYNGEAVDGIQTVSSIDYNGNADSFVKNFSVKKAGDQSTFRNVRFILRDPSNVYELYQKLTEDYKDYNFKIVDPYTFYGLMAQQNGSAK